MNLIEQFGYAKVKDALKTLIDEKKDLLTVGRAVYVREEIESMLLEHRRENNIFEKGDAVTWKAYFKGEWRCGFGFITDIDEEIECVNIDNCVGVDIYEINHASDKEIAQGYRDE